MVAASLNSLQSVVIPASRLTNDGTDVDIVGYQSLAYMTNVSL